MVALSMDLQYSQSRLSLAGIFTILWRDFITLSLYCVRACVRTHGRTSARRNTAIRWRYRQIRGELRVSVGGTRYGGALYWSTTCIVLAKIGLWLSISITRTDWLRSRAAYSPGVHTYTGGTESRILADKGIRRILPGKSSCSMITYYTARLRRGKMETEKRL